MTCARRDLEEPIPCERQQQLQSARCWKTYALNGNSSSNLRDAGRRLRCLPLRFAGPEPAFSKLKTSEVCLALAALTLRSTKISRRTAPLRDMRSCSGRQCTEGAYESKPTPEADDSGLRNPSKFIPVASMIPHEILTYEQAVLKCGSERSLAAAARAVFFCFAILPVASVSLIGILQSGERLPDVTPLDAKVTTRQEPVITLREQDAQFACLAYLVAWIQRTTKDASRIWVPGYSTS
ncbi:hypothetical protein NDU88_003762 [Pleurodeles waltl]|uniref:Uncharacterized protein n=1 Tax=Pleurodeles waltl TaxID=8319 RepID=A0AAV7QCZ7_PLEWA|nr:hypothetical protein NDU88_003762 [Pleurodeles waltl]